MSRTTVAVVVVVVVLAAGGGIVYAATRKPERDDALAAAQAAAAARAAGNAPDGDGSVIERLTGGRLSGAGAVKAQSVAADLLAEGGRRLTARASEPEVIYGGPTVALPPPLPPGSSPSYGLTNPIAPPTSNVTTGASSFGAPAFAPPPTPAGPSVRQVKLTVGRSRTTPQRRSLTRGSGSL